VRIPELEGRGQVNFRKTCLKKKSPVMEIESTPIARLRKGLHKESKQLATEIIRTALLARVQGKGEHEAVPGRCLQKEEKGHHQIIFEPAAP